MAMPCRVVNALTDSQITDLCRLYEGEWWTQGRTAEQTREMLDNSSVVVGLVDDGDRLVAFCRVLTDFVFRGTLYDVIVDEKHRGEGLGRQLMQAVTDDPRLARVSKISLACKPDKPAFYGLFGYEAFEDDLVWMVRRQRSG